jgi:3-dehydroquinate dehydratase-2
MDAGVAHFLLLNGPNLNLLGTREPQIYGHETLDVIETRLRARAEAAGHRLSAFQSNSESALITRIHATRGTGIDCALFNPAAFTHTSIALRDALAGAALPFIEIHLTNTAQREPFRHQSYFTDIAIGTIIGFGAQGYVMALDAAMTRVAGQPRSQ